MFPRSAFVESVATVMVPPDAALIVADWRRSAGINLDSASAGTAAATGRIPSGTPYKPNTTLSSVELILSDVFVSEC
jgi:hypothetical protein